MVKLLRDGEIIEFMVHRYDAARDKRLYYVVYEVPYVRGMTVLDGLLHIFGDREEFEGGSATAIPYTPALRTPLRAVDSGFYVRFPVHPRGELLYERGYFSHRLLVQFLPFFAVGAEGAEKPLGNDEGKRGREHVRRGTEVN